jgi:hypothetical protein
MMMSRRRRDRDRQGFTLIIVMADDGPASDVKIIRQGGTWKRGFHECDPTDPRSLVLAKSCFDEGEPSGWADGVSYRSREVRKCHI